EGFDPSSTISNLVNFPRTGGGATLAQVTAATSDKLTVTVPFDAATGPVTVQHVGGTGDKDQRQPPLVICDYHPYIVDASHDSGGPYKELGSPILTRFCRPSPAFFHFL